MTGLWVMLLKMTAATLIYVLITAGLCYFCRKREYIGRGMEILIGLIFGACSVVANHIGIDYGMLILNVRDIGPLSAGLFFSPLSGIIAGTIGGAERILAGEVWNIGRFTEIACAISTFLAGILAAVLNRKVYQRKRPPVPQCFFLGAVMEVFHMYSVLFTNRDEMGLAYAVVRTASIPMICFTAIGVALCSAVVKRLVGTEQPTWGVPEEQIPVTVQFQRSLLAVTIALFLFNFVLSYQFQSRLVTEDAVNALSYLGNENRIIYDESRDTKAVIQHLREQDGLNYSFMLIDTQTGKSLEDNFDFAEGTGNEGFSPEEMEIIREHSGKEPFRIRLKSLLDTEILCVNVPVGQYSLLILRSMDLIYDVLVTQMYESTLSDILLFTVLYVLVAMLVERLVVKNLKRVNVSLGRITEGKLDEVVWVRSSSEFSELSDDINKTVTALRGYIQAAEKKMEDELKLAAAIQDAALPKNFTLPTDRLELYALMIPAKQVGGDFYDFFYCGPDTLCLVVADVSGKGVPASLFMMRAKTTIKNYAQSGNKPAELLSNVNRTLCEGNDAEMFVTVWLGILDLKTGLLQCSNAGHEYPVLMRAGGDYELLKDKHGGVLAALEQMRMREYEIQLNPGDKLFIYSDGVPEAINEKEEAYGTARLVERLTYLKEGSQKRILEGTLQDIRNFAGEAEQFDDITMLGITYCP